MPQVHPTAIVDPNAELAEDVSVGPWTLIEGKVRIGAGTRIGERVTLRGPLAIGRDNVIFPGACLGLEPQDRKFDGRDGAGVVIGDSNIIREGVTIHRATGPTPTTLGSRNFIMVNAHLGHDCRIGDDCALANGALLAGHVVVQDRVVFGGNAVVHQFCRIGRLAVFSGIKGVTQDVPPFCMVYNSRRVAGLNLVGLRRAGLSAHVNNLRQAFDILYRQRLPNASAIQLIGKQLAHDVLCVEFAEFITQSRRGITRYEHADEE